MEDIVSSLDAFDIADAPAAGFARPRRGLIESRPIGLGYHSLLQR